MLSLVPAIAAAQGAAPAAPPPKPTVYFHAPANNAVVTSPFLVVFGLKNYGVAPAGVKVDRTGHFHILVDAEAGAPGEVIPNDATHLHFGAGQIEAMVTLPPGKHTLRLGLADFEHKVIGPDLISAPITVTVQAPAPKK
jgi:hypothetical protein